MRCFINGNGIVISDSNYYDNFQNTFAFEDGGGVLMQLRSGSYILFLLIDIYQNLLQTLIC